MSGGQTPRPGVALDEKQILSINAYFDRAVSLAPEPVRKILTSAKKIVAPTLKKQDYFRLLGLLYDALESNTDPQVESLIKKIEHMLENAAKGEYGEP